MCLIIWRPVRESNPCRRREREAIYGNSRKLCGMDSTVKVVGELLRDRYWTLNGRGWSGEIKVFVNQKLVLPWDDPARSLNFSRGKPLHLAGGSARPD